MMIEIYLLEQLKAFYEHGTLSAAAEHLHLAQPSLSRSMQKIEDILGVKLFERQKNRLRLNEAGNLAAKYAIQILEEEKEMEERIKAFDRSLHTISIGSCAPGPLLLLLPQASSVFSNMTLSSDVNSEEELLKGLENDRYGIIILNHPLESDHFVCKEYTTEQLYLSVNHFHPAASLKKISFGEMNGQNFIMHSNVGFWNKIVHEKMPQSKFYLQDDIDAVGELQAASDLPSFATDITLRMLASRRNNRVTVPFSNPEAFANYYLICQKENFSRFKRIFKEIIS
ncbi:MAG: LysR family transcriptional regulator [Lachnospiraceae bacterium]|nr:LysR family transcriptional regulator [Lachnospiraceae bacterium]